MIRVSAGMLKIKQF